MSNLIDRINSRMNLIEYELDLLRSMIHLYSIEENNRSLFNRERRYTREDRSINSFLNNIRQRRQQTNEYFNLNSTNLNQNIPNQNQNLNRNFTLPNNSTNTNTPNLNNRNSIDNLLNNLIPDLIEVSIIDSNGRPVRPNRTSLENLRLNTTIEVIEEDNDSMCTICRNNFSEGDVVRKITSCNHMFHINCIDQWFEEHTTCPTCRTNIGIREHQV